MITLWLSAQAIIVENIVIAVILYADLLNIPKYLTSFLQKTYIDNPHNSEISAKILTTTSNNTSLNNIHNNEQNKNHVEALKNNNHTVLMTPNEKNVLDLIIAGFSQKEIAKKLQISRTRITQHIAKICNKCGYTGYSSKYLKKYFADTVSV